MYQAYGNKLLNQKESQNADSGRILSDTSQHPLFIATRRLVKALDRLEGNLKQGLPRPAGNDESDEKIIVFERENAELKQEREKLNRSIAELQRQYNDLQKIASGIYIKLDHSIQRLTQIIEE